MVYLIMGLPGTGKTYFARALAEQLDAVHANTDSIRAEHDLMGQYDREDKERVYQLLLDRMLESARNGHTVVIDATFTRKSLRDRFIQPLEQEDIPFRLVQMLADHKIVEKRVQKDRPDSEAGIEVHDRLKDALEPVERGHITLDSGKMELEDMLQEIVEGT